MSKDSRAEAEKFLSRDFRPIVFFRADGWYPTTYPVGYENWQAEAERNPGTLRIEDMDGNVLWPNGGMTLHYPERGRTREL